MLLVPYALVFEGWYLFYAFCGPYPYRILTRKVGLFSKRRRDNKLVQKKPRRFEKHTKTNKRRDTTKIFDFCVPSKALVFKKKIRISSCIFGFT